MPSVADRNLAELSSPRNVPSRYLGPKYNWYMPCYNDLLDAGSPVASEISEQTFRHQSGRTIGS